jgi:hypothetical protein
LAGEGTDEVLQLEQETGEVRDYPTEGKGGARVELTVRGGGGGWRHDGGGPVARREHEAKERREGRDGGAQGALAREDERGKERGISGGGFLSVRRAVGK